MTSPTLAGRIASIRASVGSGSSRPRASTLRWTVMVPIAPPSSPSGRAAVGPAGVALLAARRRGFQVKQVPCGDHADDLATLDHRQMPDLQLAHEVGDPVQIGVEP